MYLIHTSSNTIPAWLICLGLDEGVIMTCRKSKSRCIVDVLIGLNDAQPQSPSFVQPGSLLTFAIVVVASSEVEDGLLLLLLLLQ